MISIVILLIVGFFIWWYLSGTPKKPTKVDKAIKEAKSGIYIYDYISNVINVNINTVNSALTPGYYLGEIKASSFSYMSYSGRAVLCYFNDCHNAELHKLKQEYGNAIKCIVHISSTPSAIVFVQKKQIDQFSLINKLKVLL